MERPVILNNEDHELVLPLQSLKQTIKQLMEELNEKEVRSQENEAEYRVEVKRSREENERQQKLFGENLMKGSDNSETYLQSEIIRLTSENLSLQSRVDSLTEQLMKYERTLKIYSDKLKEVGVEPSDTLETEIGDGEYMGMFEYDRRDEKTIIKSLIYDFEPLVPLTLPPCLPSNILFMCIRHADHINDDEKVRSLLNNTVNGIKQVIKKRYQNLDSTVLWLSNTLRLLNNLKQYSGERTFQEENTQEQNEQSLKNFDLSEYRKVISDIGVWIYSGVIKLMKERIQHLIASSILEHEAITDLSGNKTEVLGGLAGSLARELESQVKPKNLDLLLEELEQFYKTLAMFGIESEIITQVFRQLFYFICAGALNNLLLRSDMCHWFKGMQIRNNLTHLGQLIRKIGLNEARVTCTLAPIIQAAQLLQSSKTDEDVNDICSMCDKLSVTQIIRILNLYNPVDKFEERVPDSFIQKMKAKLEERAKGETPDILLMNTKHAIPVQFPFNPSSIRLEDIEIPDILNLTVLHKI
ncbi:UNVERIFIED_CONTAM: hypothetical protein RMT77_005924 [Armadillidium vulgare]